MDTCAHGETVVKILDPRYRGSALEWRRTRKICSVACVSRWRVPSSSVLTHTRGGNTTSQHGPNEVCSSRLMDFLDNVIVEGEGARDTSRTGQVRPRPDRCPRGLPNEPRQRCTPSPEGATVVTVRAFVRFGHLVWASHYLDLQYKHTGRALGQFAQDRTRSDNSTNDKIFTDTYHSSRHKHMLFHEKCKTICKFMEGCLLPRVPGQGVEQPFSSSTPFQDTRDVFNP